MDNLEASIDATVCALLRGDPVAWPASLDARLEERLRDHATYHGVGPLLAREHSRTMPGDGDSGRSLKDDAAIELVRKHEMVRVLDALARARVTVLVLKGTALAYSIYPAPVLRPRADTDLLIRSGDRDSVARTLETLGYRIPNAVSGELVSYQRGYTLRDRFVIDHVLDVHWRISNAQLFSLALDFDELLSRSIQLPTLGAHARGLSLVDALLLACMHRVHHFHSAYRVENVSTPGRERLIWLYDMHLLVNAMTRGELMAFARRAEERGVRAVCGDGLEAARRCFGTPIAEEVMHVLRRAGPREASAAQLSTGHAGRLLIELRALRRWRDRVALLGEHLFPPPAYMREKYAVSGRAWLPLLYLQRGIRGAWKRLHES